MTTTMRGKHHRIPFNTLLLHKTLLTARRDKESLLRGLQQSVLVCSCIYDNINFTGGRGRGRPPKVTVHVENTLRRSGTWTSSEYQVCFLMVIY
jgi:hypothetical protein